jgi:hypothetical protein
MSIIEFFVFYNLICHRNKIGNEKSNLNKFDLMEELIDF